MNGGVMAICSKCTYNRRRDIVTPNTFDSFPYKGHLIEV